MSASSVKVPTPDIVDRVIILIDSFMPEKFVFQVCHSLEKVIDHILGRASNQPQNCQDYVKLCLDIRAELCSIDFDLSELFIETLINALKGRIYYKLLCSNDQKMKVRLGTMRFLGEMYNFKIISPTLLHTVIDELTKSQLSLQRELFELISVTGYPLVEPRAKSKTDKSKNVDIQCPICLEDVIANCPVSTACGHIFCEMCMKGYLKEKEKPKCPVCKESISKDKKRFHRIFI